MISNVLKALEILLSVVRDKNSPQVKRSKIGKSFLRIHHNLSIVVERGTRILSTIEDQELSHDQEAGLYYVHDSTLELLEEQYRALQSLIDELRETQIDAILRVYLPNITDPFALLFFKSEQVALFLATLYEEQKDIGHRNDPTTFFSVLDSLKGEVDAYRTELGLESLEEEILYDGYDEVPVGAALQMGLAHGGCLLMAAPEQIERAKVILQELSVVAEQIRMFIKENFKLEDLL